MENMLKKSANKYDMIIGSTKKGKILFKIEKQLAKDLVRSNGVLIAFGDPKHVIDEIAGKEGFNINEYCDYLINFIPRQG